MNNTCLVSVLTTVYNREKYLEDCIESVLHSTYQNWELIIVDDGSTDTSVEIANRYSNEDARIKLYINEKNIGDYANRNMAASYAKGKYIKYLDADDTIFPEGLEVMLATMENFPDAALGISQQVLEDELPYPFQLFPEEIYHRQFIQKGILDLGPTGTIIRRDVFKKVGGFSGKRYVGDTELWLKISAKYPVVKITPDLVYWRRHENQEFNHGDNNDVYIVLDYKVRLDALKSEDCPIKDFQKKRYAFLWLKFRLSRKILRIMLLSLAPKRAWEMKKETSERAFDILLAFLPFSVYQKIRSADA